MSIPKKADPLVSVKLKDFTSKINEIRASGGGASSNVWLQIKADVLNTPITAISAKEIGAAGTCAVAGIEIGVYNDLKETVNKMVKVRQVFYPNSEKAEKYDALYQKYRNIYNAVKGL